MSAAAPHIDTRRPYGPSIPTVTSALPMNGTGPHNLARWTIKRITGGASSVESGADPAHWPRKSRKSLTCLGLRCAEAPKPGWFCSQDWRTCRECCGKSCSLGRTLVGFARSEADDACRDVEMLFVGG
eukprot:2002967-Rhodomonas_salina.1